MALIVIVISIVVSSTVVGIILYRKNKQFLESQTIKIIQSMENNRQYLESQKKEASEIKNKEREIALQVFNEKHEMTINDIKNLPNARGQELLTGMLPAPVVNSIAYLQTGNLYKLNQDIIGSQMSLKDGVGSAVMGDNGKIVGHNSFEPMVGSPMQVGLVIYQVGTVIFSAAHLAAISQSLKEINKKIDDLAYRFNFREFSKAYANYMLLREISEYLQEHHQLQDEHKIQLALLKRDIIADKIYYDEMIKRVSKHTIESADGKSLREYVEKNIETILLDVHGCYLTSYSAVLYRAMDNPQNINEEINKYNQSIETYNKFKNFVNGDVFENVFLAVKFPEKMSNVVIEFIKTLPFLKKINFKDNKQLRKNLLQEYRDSIPTLNPIKGLPQNLEIYLYRQDDEIFVYTISNDKETQQAEEKVSS
ncbi:MAG: hypothetical protein ACRCY4_00595 [Brevinema sp.]